MEKNDQQLVAEYLAGDKQSLTELIDRHLAVVYRYALRLTRDPERADDITQETLVKMWKHLKKYDQDKSFRTWLLTIAHNTALDVLRKRKDILFSEMKSADEEGEGFSEMIADSAPFPLEIFERVEQKKLLDDALGKLSVSAREIITLHHEQELTFEEIGTILNKPLNTVKSQYRRALGTLRELLLLTMHQNE